MRNHFQLPAALVLGATLLLSGTAAARERQGGSSGMATPGVVKAAGCAPSTTVSDLWVNNVRCLIETGGNMWQDRASSAGAAYEVPATADFSGAKALFAGSLWMGGLSPDNQLKIAAVRFRQDGNDFWPGPLTNTGDASTTPEECLEWDRTWRAGRQDAIEQQAYFECLQTPGCDAATAFPDYVVPSYFFDWPAIGDVGAGQDQYIAPFVDFDQDGDYDPSQGDMPDYGLNEGNLDCKNKVRESPVTLFGDSTIWWVFNDKGNTHGETNGQPIGMEVRAQAFAFATNDEVNNMTFYNYVLINQGTQTLTETYFGQYVDPDLGYSDDDFVGCDVQRGLGYVYNGDNNDETTSNGPGYGTQPPACGIDFFEGPFVDYDGVDNPLTLDYADAIANNGIPYKGIGIGYGDGKVDNERYGMRVFMYYTNGAADAVSDPAAVAIDHYNYLKAIWKDGSHLLYGGNGHFPTDDPDQDLECLYMCPGDSDPIGWGTGGVPQYPWTEESSGNSPDDRRFIESAGPFTLEPGAYNNITVGVVWARASGGGPFASVERVRTADDKAQSLFDNCFKILNGPDAPTLSVIELDRELVLTVSNPLGSNNYNETYEELDPTIPEDAPDRYYRFQGYEIYQLRDSKVSVADLRDAAGNIDPDLARIVAVVDLKDGVTQLVNYNYNDVMGLPVPTLMVAGPDEGVAHSFRVTEDKFSGTGDPRLVNFKTYYFLALAYGYNNYAPYNAVELTGQAFPYKAGRKSATGSIRSVSGIPHKNSPEDGGTVLNAQYGDQFQITRIEGQGNGGLEVDLEQSTIDGILNSSDSRKDLLKYKLDLGPVAIKVVDPLNVPAADFELWFKDTTDLPDFDPTSYPELEDAYWALVKVDGDPTEDDTVWADKSIAVRNEQLILKWGLSVTVEQTEYTDGNDYTELINAEAVFADPGQEWLTGMPDQEGENLLNWIRAGTANDEGILFPDRVNVDNEEVYEDVLGGTWSPWPLCGDTAFQPCGTVSLGGRNVASISECPSVVVVLTPDKGKWTRCGVVEETEIASLAEHGDKKMLLRSDKSRDKNGIESGELGCNEEEASLNGAEPTGMSWFPGYAIDLENGERLNMAFGEDSFWGGAAGKDMVWNPTDQLLTPLGELIGAGSHWIYIFKNQFRSSGQSNRMPAYDKGVYMYNNIGTENTANNTRCWRSCAWVGSAVLVPGFAMKSMADGLVPGEVRIRINVNKPYTAYIAPPGYPTPIPESGTSFRNGGLPLYTFNTGPQATLVQQIETAKTACDLIDVVPNPYYSFSGYETTRLDNRVKFINLPQTCTISIYNVSGTLVRRFKKDNELTYVDWDLRNQVNVPIAGGVYICHIDVPGVCERVVKWFGVMRPVDLQNF